MTYQDLCEEILAIAKRIGLSPSDLLFLARVRGGHSVTFSGTEWPSGRDIFNAHPSGEMFWIRPMRDGLLEGEATQAAVRDLELGSLAPYTPPAVHDQEC